MASSEDVIRMTDNTMTKKKADYGRQNTTQNSKN